ncbi:MAG: glycosyltransferase [Candidatus Thermoplasmatota archaeon]
MFVSIIITVRNEGYHISDLLDSLVVQEQPFEIIVIDAGSTDDTVSILERYKKEYKFIKIYHHGGTRGACRNFGAEQANGDVLAFIDGDCIANPFWLREIRKGFEKSDIVAGKTIHIGYRAFVELDRVELHSRGTDVTYPSCNLAYKKDLFHMLEGFDPTFRTAEDIDINYRAVTAGNKLEYNKNAIVYHRARSTFIGFLKQALWNGYGRKQLTLKHGSLWSNYSLEKMFKGRVTFFYLVRLAFALLGYFIAALIVKNNKPSPRGIVKLK